MSQTQRQAHYYALAQKLGLDYQGGPPSQPCILTGLYHGHKVNLQTQVVPSHLRVALPISFMTRREKRNEWSSILLRNFYHTVSVSLTLAVANSYPYISFSLRTRNALVRLWDELRRRVDGRTKRDEFHERFVIEINPEDFLVKVFDSNICQRLNSLTWKLTLELGAGGLIFEQADDLTNEQAEKMLTLMSDLADRVEALQN